MSCSEKSAQKPEYRYDKLVVIGPNLTEIVASLGFSQHIIGIDNWSDPNLASPNAVKVGGILNPNLELIASLKPNAIFIAGNSRDFENFLGNYSIEVLSFTVEDTASILCTIDEISKLLNREKTGDSIIFNIRKEVKSLSALHFPYRPKVLIAITSGTSTPEKFMSANSNTFLGEIISIAGGENVLGDNTVLYPEITRETVVVLNPEIIIELFPSEDTEDSLKMVEKWIKAYPGIQASKNKHIHIVFDESVLLPGPNFIESALYIHSVLQRAVNAEN
ncbi:ABC transporter substrate-binding protein [candidate division WOR-3 bacterium]|nr:ABC transporter substrate-binding protein [candidate division WOR-3 bacterium]